MSGEYAVIRNRYRDVLCGLSERQMLEDILVLVRYVDLLHAVIRRQAEIRVAEEADRLFAGCDEQHAVPN